MAHARKSQRLQTGGMSEKGVHKVTFNYLVSLSSACATQGLISKHKQKKNPIITKYQVIAPIILYTLYLDTLLINWF